MAAAAGSLMYGVRSQFVMSLLAGFCCLSLVCPVFAGQIPKPHKAAKTPVAAPPAAPSQPPTPLTLQQMPATPPQVSYKDGELTVVAKNSTLGDILRAVREQTGADLDVPVNATERVVGQMGPGSARDVLAELLDGSHFNYVILGSATDSTKVERVLLSLKPPPSLENAVQAPVNVASTPLAPGDQQAGDDDDDASEAPGDQPNQPPTQPPVRTPEQLLQELQRQQQQQQQQQQPGQPPAPAPPQRN